MSSEATVGRRAHRLLGQTAYAVRGALARRDGKAVFAAVAVAYLAAYLYGLDYLALYSGPVDVAVVDDPFARATERVAPYQWEPVALLAAGPIQVLLSPLNVLLGIGLGALVGVNLAVSWVAYRGPSACGLSPGAGAAAGVPALLSGFACCGPTILLVVGVQASAGLIAAFQWLVPLSVALLLATLVWVGRRVDPDAVAA